MTRPSEPIVAQNGHSPLDAEIEGAWTVCLDSDRLPPRVMDMDAVALYAVFEAGFLYGNAAAHRQAGALGEVARELRDVFDRIDARYRVADAGYVALAADVADHSDCPVCIDASSERAKEALFLP